MDKYKQAWNWTLLGLVMLLGGLAKLFIMKATGLAGMLGGLGFPSPTILAWLLIIAEIGSGIAILARWKLDQVVWIPIVIILTAIVMYWKSPLFAGKLPLQLTQTPIHVTLASNYWLLGNRK